MSVPAVAALVHGALPWHHLVSTPASPMDVSMIPPEIWMHIFSQLISTHDLAMVTRTCKTFNLHATRLLYKNVSWVAAEKIGLNMGIWARVPNASIFPRKLTIGVADCLWRGANDHPHAHRTLEELKTQIHLMESQRPRAAWNHPMMMMHQQNPAQANAAAIELSAELNQLRALGYMMERFRMLDEAQYTHMLAVASSFANLRTLQFANTLLPFGLHSFLRSLPNLRVLRILRCELLWKHAFDSEAAQASQATLPLRELELDCMPGVFPDDPARELGMVQLYRLAEAATLVKVKMRWHPRVMPHVLLAMQEHEAYPMQSLSDLHLTIDGFSAWPAEPRRALFTFLGDHQGILRLEITTSDDVVLALAPHALPRLTTLKARHDVVGALSRHRQLDTVHVTGFDQADVLIDNLAGLDTKMLTTLSIHGRRFEEEALGAVCFSFRALRWLRFTYTEGRPTEQLVLSLGGLHLNRVPQLETLHIYKTSPYTLRYAERDEDFEETLGDAVKAWSRFCPQLREVQFARDEMWRREDAGDLWALRRFEWSDDGRVILGMQSAEAQSRAFQHQHHGPPWAPGYIPGGPNPAQPPPYPALPADIDSDDDDAQ